MLASRSWLSFTSLRLPKRASASSKSRMAPLSSAVSKIRRRFFSVSPIYLLTTALKIDSIEVEAQFICQYFSGHRFADTAHAHEERADAETAICLAGKTPVLIDLPALAHMHGNLLQDRALQIRYHQVFPRSRNLDTLSQIT